MDYAISNWVLNTFGGSKFFAVLSSILTFWGSTWAVTLVLAILVYCKKSRNVGICCTLAVLMSLLINNVILKNIVQRPRPFEEYEAMYRICELANYAPPTGYSMASGHASATMAVAVALFMFSKKWGAVAISASIVVGLTRVALLVHYMTDVLVGWAIGAALAIGVYYLFRYVYKKIQIKIQEKRGNYEKIDFSIDK